LDRAEYLNRDATFVIDAGEDSEPRKFAGWISEFSKTRQTRDFCAYEMVVVPQVARLRLTKRSRIYQQKTAPQIIEAILRGHELKGHQFAFKTRRTYPQLAFRMQYEMSDWDYIRLLMEQEGCTAISRQASSARWWCSGTTTTSTSPSCACPTAKQQALSRAWKRSTKSRRTQ
jgi:type VI secretion system secreted protein VgrG